MRFWALAMLALAVGGCGNDNSGTDLAPGRNDLSSAEIEAALGPADQAAINDLAPQNSVESDDPSNKAGTKTTDDGSAPNEEEL